MRPGRARHDRAMTGGRRWLLPLRLLTWLLTASAAALVLAAVVVPRLGGATPYTVLTGSMAPVYPPGSLVVVRPVESTEVRIGDVVTYQLRSGEPAVATHRVVGVGWSADGERLLTTQGDANPVPDAEPVRGVQLRGEVWYSLPWVGHLNVLLTPGQHQRLVQLAALQSGELTDRVTLSGGITASVKNFIRLRSDSIPAMLVRSGSRNRPAKPR